MMLGSSFAGISRSTLQSGVRFIALRRRRFASWMYRPGWTVGILVEGTPCGLRHFPCAVSQNVCHHPGSGGQGLFQSPGYLAALEKGQSSAYQ